MNKRVVCVLMAMLMAMSLILTGCSASANEMETEEKAKNVEITIGSKLFTENIILSKMLVKYLEHNGYQVVDESGLGATGVARAALVSGQIDAYWEYTGTVLIHFMEHDPVYESEESYEIVKEWDEANNGLLWLNYAPVNNTYCLVARKDFMEENNISTISDLGKSIQNGDNVRFVSNPEYFERPDGMPHVEKSYGFELPESNKVLLDLGLFYEALKNNEGDVTTGFTTDGTIDAFGFGVLEDDKAVFPVYNATPVFRKEIIDAYPELPELVNKLSALIDNETAMKLNKSVDVDGKDIDEIAVEFLKENGLIN